MTTTTAGVYMLASEHADAVQRFAADPSLAATFGMPLLAGRDFGDADAATGFAGPVIVNTRFAERFGLTPDAIVGRRIVRGQSANGAPLTNEIVGVIGDLRLSGKVTDDVPPQVFFASLLRRAFYVQSARSPENLFN